MSPVIQAMGLTLLMTLGSIIIVGGLMWLLYVYFNRFLNKQEKEEKDA